MTTQLEHNKRPFRILPLLLTGILLLCLGISMYFGNMYIQVEKSNGLFASNLYINDVPIGGLTYDEALATLNEQVITPFLDQSVTLVTPISDASVILSYATLGVTYNITDLLDEAYTLSHEGTLTERYKRIKEGFPSPHNFTLTPSINEEKLKEEIARDEATFYKAPIDATMDRVNRTFVFTNEKVGYALDQASLLKTLSEKLMDNVPFELVVPLAEVNPTYTASYLKTLQTPLASFHTSYNNNDRGRNENIRLASENINTLLMPGEKFSYAKQLEPIDLASGYQYAKVISNGAFTEGIGGGICQVTSTLYNAVIRTDLDIYMRRNHSLPVGYTPLGLDATYATNSVDFQFINNSGHPLYVESYCENNNVYVNLYGHKDFKPTYEAKFESVVEEEIAPGEPRFEDDPTLAVGTEVYQSSGKPGYKVSTYKLYYKNGELVKKEKINTSNYKPQRPIIKRGTKQP